MRIKSSQYNNYLFVLVIEDDPDPEYSSHPPVQPVGTLDKRKVISISSTLFNLGIKHNLWSHNASLFVPNVVIGATEISDSDLPLQDYFCGLAHLYKESYEHGGFQTLGKSFPIDISANPMDQLKEMAQLIVSSFELVHPPYAIPIVIYDDTDFSWCSLPMEPDTFDSFKALGKDNFGEGSVAALLPISIGTKMTMQ